MISTCYLPLLLSPSSELGKYFLKNRRELHTSKSDFYWAIHSPQESDIWKLRPLWVFLCLDFSKNHKELGVMILWDQTWHNPPLEGI